MNDDQALAIRALQDSRSAYVAYLHEHPQATRDESRFDAAIAAVNAAFVGAERYAKLGRMLDGDHTLRVNNVLAAREIPTLIHNKAALDALLDKEPT